ncbi:PP2C family protein-serine/threonine phosphatase [Engelhardtia mirabilis]|uniref:PPM-type phosphatase domain-containing protein n=1 Tax=Engelhardtia mirabilis TaxID=2528011 RepID=A0A518BHV1_9BACT|nr:Putative protein phosphatase 2C-type [Planctomycetes bacterium Pla133]QDV00884.1 Putative protein phosphatase 2C-type [Planctomycetes bacterium Pla86]
MLPGPPLSAQDAFTTRFYTGCNRRICEGIDLTAGELVVYTSPSPLHPDRNEDGAAVFRVGDAVVIAVADGVGGLPGGAMASTRALEEIGRTLGELGGDVTESRLRNAVLDGIELAHRAIRETGDGGATTLAAVEILGRQLRTYHAGDSAILIFDADGELRLQTVAHSPVGYALESGLITEAEAFFHDHRNIIFNCLGLERIHIEFSSAIELDPGDTVLLATDGLFDNLTLAELSELSRGGELASVCQQLESVATERMNAPGGQAPSKPDDLTFATFRLAP